MNIGSDDIFGSKEKGFEFLDHPADVWVHAWGSTLHDAFEECVYALMKTMFENWPESVEKKKKKDIAIEEINVENALVSFLSEFLYIFDIDGFVFRSVDIKEFIEKDDGTVKIVAEGYGEEFDPSRHIPDTEVKAVTYSYLEINKTAEKVDIKIVFDI